MTERQMEIIISRGIELVFGEGSKLHAQQLGVGNGRLDLFVSQPNGIRTVVELKKGRLAEPHIAQAIGYAEALSTDSGMEICAMVVANAASSQLIALAAARGVQVKVISESQLSRLSSQLGLSESDLLGDRRREGVLFGGRAGLRTYVPLQTALAECPEPIRGLVAHLRANFPQLDLEAGKLQIVLHYKGIKVGGLNRFHRGGGTYVSTGVVLTDDHRKLLEMNQFSEMSQNTTGTNEHVWWERRWIGTQYVNQSECVFRYFFDVIDEALSGNP